MRIVIIVVEAGEETTRGALVTFDEEVETAVEAIRQGAQALVLDAADVTWEYGRGTIRDSKGALVAKCCRPKPFSNILDENPA